MGSFGCGGAFVHRRERLAIEFLPVDRCGTMLAVGIAAASVVTLRACEVPIEASVVSCPPNAPHAESGVPATLPGRFDVSLCGRSLPDVLSCGGGTARIA